MVNVVSRAISSKCLYLYGECCGECCEQSKSVHTWTKCLYLYGECCEESKSVHTWVNVVSKMFILIW